MSKWNQLGNHFCLFGFPFHKKTIYNFDMHILWCFPFLYVHDYIFSFLIASVYTSLKFCLAKAIQISIGNLRYCSHCLPDDIYCSVQCMVRNSISVPLMGNSNPMPCGTQNLIKNDPDSKVHGVNMGPIWGRQDPGGPNVGPMNFAIWGGIMIRKWFSFSDASFMSKGHDFISRLSNCFFLSVTENHSLCFKVKWTVHVFISFQLRLLIPW